MVVQEPKLTCPDWIWLGVYTETSRPPQVPRSKSVQGLDVMAS